jgi:hypothetical protein
MAEVTIRATGIDRRLACTGVSWPTKGRHSVGSAMDAGHYHPACIVTASRAASWNNVWETPVSFRIGAQAQPLPRLEIPEV